MPAPDGPPPGTFWPWGSPTGGLMPHARAPKVHGGTVSHGEGRSAAVDGTQKADSAVEPREDLRTISNPMAPGLVGASGMAENMAPPAPPPAKVTMNDNTEKKNLATNNNDISYEDDQEPPDQVSTRRHIKNTARVVTTQDGVIPDDNEHAGLPGIIYGRIPNKDTEKEEARYEKAFIKALVAIVVPNTIKAMGIDDDIDINRRPQDDVARIAMLPDAMAGMPGVKTTRDDVVIPRGKITYGVPQNGALTHGKPPDKGVPDEVTPNEDPPYENEGLQGMIGDGIPDEDTEKEEPPLQDDALMEAAVAVVIPGIMPDIDMPDIMPDIDKDLDIGHCPPDNTDRTAQYLVNMVEAIRAGVRKRPFHAMDHGHVLDLQQDLKDAAVLEEASRILKRRHGHLCTFDLDMSVE